MATLMNVLALLLLSLAPMQAPPAQAPAAQQRPPDLEEPVDEIVAWLRGSQDRVTGCYAGGVEGTSWVLRALADCRRKYRRIDGPFVAKALDALAARQEKDGSIHDPGATPEVAHAQTALAIMALNRHADEASKAVLAKALAYAATNKIEPAGTDIQAPASREEALKLALTLLGKRNKDGVWDGPRGPVIETARALCAINEVAPLLASKSESKPAASLPKLEEADRAKALAALQRGAEYLASQCLPERPGIFGFGGRADAGLTSMALGGLLCVPEPRPEKIQKAVDGALAWLVSLQKPDGAIHDGMLANYCTSAAIMALARAKKPEYQPVILKARDFLVKLQNDEAEGFSPDHPFYGGNSYGDEQRPDLSNVQMALEALAASGLEKDNVAYKRALLFLQRCQNRSESNDIKIEDGGKLVVSGDDGGAAYGPGMSKAGFIDLPDGRKVPRSYGSMSYALLKGYIFCGVPKDDPRMQALVAWLRKNYTLDVNPGFSASKDPTEPYQGLYYYLHTMAKALALYGEEEIVDASGNKNPWRKQLCGRIVSMQNKADGSWSNQNSPRWYEGNPLLATSYALMALDLALPH
jgi:squalene-hopene/tetraprenyl-beta-curcumene cyclase